MAAAGALLVSSGLALMAAPSPAAAGDTRAAESTCTPSEAYTETSDWVLTSPGTGWYQVDERQVLVTPAVDPSYGPGQRYSWNPQGPYDESAVPPAWPTPAQGRWTANTEAYYPGHAGEPVGVVFEQGRGHDGDNASWFYWERVLVTPGSDEVYRTEYRFAFDHAAVSCPVAAYADVQWIEPSCGTKADFKARSGDPVDVTWSAPSATPAPGVTVTLTATAMDGYAFDGSPTRLFTHTYAAVVPPAGQTYDPVTGVCATTVPPVVEPPVTPTPTTVVSPPKAHVKAKAHAQAETTTPTVVHAGLATTATQGGVEAGLGLALTGLLLLAGAGGLVAGGGERERAA